MKFCCKDFISKKKGRFISFYPDDRTKKIILEYYPRNREYSIIYGSFGYNIKYCPWCGTKLPKDLWDEWYDILEKDYNILDPIMDDRDKVPLEFWTDEWWKKRGL